jgi:hypothetical protein
MFKQKPFPFSLFVLIILIILHGFGSYYSLYWTYSWYDILVHIIGGLWISLIFLWLASELGQINSLKEYKPKSFLIAFVSAIFIGVLWEILENLWHLSYVNADVYSFDTAMDLLSGGLGGVLGYLYFVKKRSGVEKVATVLESFPDQIGIIKG